MLKANKGKKNAISEINRTQMKKLKELEPRAWAQIERQYAKVAGEYFGGTNLVFMYSKADRNRVGEIIAAGTINAKAVEMHAITSGTIKPSINLKDIKKI